LTDLILPTNSNKETNFFHGFGWKSILIKQGRSFGEGDIKLAQIFGSMIDLHCRKTINEIFKLRKNNSSKKSKNKPDQSWLMKLRTRLQEWPWAERKAANASSADEMSLFLKETTAKEIPLKS
jgi:hypothetical protein